MPTMAQWIRLLSCSGALHSNLQAQETRYDAARRPTQFILVKFSDSVRWELCPARTTLPFQALTDFSRIARGSGPFDRTRSWKIRGSNASPIAFLLFSRNSMIFSMPTE